MRLRTALLAAAALGAGVLAWANAPAATLPPGVRADSLVVRKADRALELYAGGAVVWRTRVSLGGQPTGPKRREGDQRTPEGRYRIDGRNPGSCCYRSLRISYPDAADAARARAAGEAPGGWIMIHGLVNGFGGLGRLHRLADWTDGCVAVTDAEMAVLWDAVPDETPVFLWP